MNVPLLNLHYGTGGTLVADVLYALGVEYIFTIPGSQTLPIMHGISRSKRINIVVSRSERNSAFMAEGYGKALNFPAVVLSTLGPGVANELPALYSAKKNNSPLLSITPFQPPWKLPRLGEVFQGLNHPEFLKGVVKRNYILNEIENLPETITDAFRYSLGEPKGPVHIDISFPILFEPHFYSKFNRNNIREDCSEGLYIIFEKPEFRELLESSMFFGNEKIFEFFPGDATGTLPFALGVKLGVKDRPVASFLTLENLMKNLDSLAVATANGAKPVLISLKKNTQLEMIADIFKIEYKCGFSNTFFQKSNTLDIVVMD